MAPRLPKTAQGVPEASQDHPFSTWVPQMVVLFGVFKKHAKNERRLLRVVLRFHCFWYFTFNKEPPRAPKEAPKEHPELPRTPKSFQGALKNSQRLPKEPPRAPKEHPRAPKEHPRAPKEPPGSPSQCAYFPQKHPRAPEELPRAPKEHPRSTQRAPWNCSQEHLRKHFCYNVQLKHHVGITIENISISFQHPSNNLQDSWATSAKAKSCQELPRTGGGGGGQASSNSLCLLLWTVACL